MFCPKCGKQVEENFRFCDECGAPIVLPARRQSDISHQQDFIAGTERDEDWDMDASKGVDAIHPSSIGAEMAPEETKTHEAMNVGDALKESISEASGPDDEVPSAVEPAKESGKSISSKTLVVIVAVIAVVALAIGGIAGFLLGGDNEARNADAEAHRLYQVPIKIEIPEYDEATGTPAILFCKGEDFEGNSVGKYLPVKPSDNCIELMRGVYTIKFIVSPVNEDGRIYKNETVFTVAVDEQGAHIVDKNGIAFDAAEPLYVMVESSKVTDRQIEAVESNLIRIGYSEKEAKEICNRIADNRDAALSKSKTKKK